MRKLIAMVMICVAMMSNVAFGATIGSYEKDQILKGNFEVVDLNTKASLSQWTEPDFWGNQYRLYTYTIGDTEEIVCLRHHCTKEEAKQIKANAKK